ncbi:hypothetical protein ACSU6B_07050 [Neobacillus sp. C211]|uniref:hypothetical protein n=1 Tax=unclassified Neobacillus TaxID=2675272 RepID=UPI003979995A
MEFYLGVGAGLGFGFRMVGGMYWVDSAKLRSDSAEFLNDSAKLGLYSANFNNNSAKTRMISAKLLFSYLFLEYSDLDFFDFQGIALLIVRADSAKLRLDSAEFLNDSAKLGLYSANFNNYSAKTRMISAKPHF